MKKNKNNKSTGHQQYNQLVKIAISCTRIEKQAGAELCQAQLLHRLIGDKL